jgi:hypothetical protein
MSVIVREHISKTGQEKPASTVLSRLSEVGSSARLSLKDFGVIRVINNGDTASVDAPQGNLQLPMYRATDIQHPLNVILFGPVNGRQISVVLE